MQLARPPVEVFEEEQEYRVVTESVQVVGLHGCGFVHDVIVAMIG